MYIHTDMATELSMGVNISNVFIYGGNVYCACIICPAETLRCTAVGF